MKKIMLIIFLSILLKITCKEEEILFDCEYKKEYEINMKSFTDGYIPEDTRLFFRLPINTKEQNAVTIKILNDEDYPSSLDVYFYSEKPTDSEAKSRWGTYDWVHEEEAVKDKIYTKYIYPIDDHYTGNYIVITFDTEVNYHYFSILVSSYKEKGYYMKEIEYNKEHVIKKVNNYINNFQFWLKAKNNKKEYIRIKLHKDDSECVDATSFALYWLRVSPLQLKNVSKDVIDYKIFQGYDFVLNETDNDYIKYYYEYSQPSEKAKYLYLQYISTYNLKYFSIGVGNDISDSSGYLKIIPSKYAILALLLLVL